MENPRTAEDLEQQLVNALAERDRATEEQKKVCEERDRALEAQKKALQERDCALAEQKKALQERDLIREEYHNAMSSRAAYESIVGALSEDYFNLYYVDLETDDFIEYGSRTDSGHRAGQTRGTDFFAECRQNALRYLYQEDQQKFIAALGKEALTAQIRKHGMMTLQYRLLMNGEPAYVNLKAVYGSEDDRHVIIGVHNIDAQIKDREAALRAREDRKAYLRFSALNNNLIALYLVELGTEHFSEFVSSGSYEDLGIEKEGDCFFRRTYENSLRTVHKEDLELFHSQVTRDNILRTIDQDGVFMLDYRLLIGAAPFYVRMKASRFVEDGKEMLILGLLDEDAQIRHQKKIVDDLSFARKMATIDAMTGVKNKYAYNEAQERMDRRIAEGSVSGFSVAVFDLNNLKVINDTRGHDAGDEYIKEACRMICTTFKHSPVYRIGGDEFTAILENADYINQEALLERFEKQVLGNLDRGKAVVSFGCARFNPQQDKNFRMVFERADAMMYTEKLLLKSLGAAVTEEQPEKVPQVLDASDISAITVRRHVLIADDIESNREILGDLLKDDYDILYAADGVETMEMLRLHKDEIAILLLDLYMPNMTGRDVMTAMQVDEELMFIPVIFISVDPHAELDCLKLGAIDFIPKPYPDIDIIKARIDRCIELSENRDLIRKTQRDKLTGLYNIDYFIRYVNRYDQYYLDVDFDVVVCNVSQFHALNEQYGQQFCDLVLRSIGIGIKKLARKTGGIGCRKEGDTFLLYIPHRNDYEQQLKSFLADLFFEEEIADKVTMRFGIFPYAQKEPDIEERFIRAKTAADMSGNDQEELYGVYEYEEA